MKLKNEALEKLYGTIVNSTITISPFSESPVDEAFKECDEKLSESVTFEQLKNLQDRNDILEKSNGILLDANLDLCTKNRDLKNRISILEKELDEAKSSVNYFKASRDDWRSRAKHEEEEKIEQVKRADNLVEQVNKVLGEKVQLQQEIEQLNKDKEWLTHSRLEWAMKAVKRGKELNEADDKNQDLTKDRNIWVRNNGVKQAGIAELKNRLDKANADRTALQKNLDYYMDIYKKVQDDYDDLHNKYSECQGTVDKQAEQIRNLKAKQDSVRKNCYDQGQTDLWVKLQDVKDMQPNEFDVECECLGDVIDMDLEDFLDSYKKWWEEKEKERLEHMRDYLNRFCKGRLCSKCPLHTDNFKCEGVIGFNNIPDEDLPRYYEKARGCGQYTLKDAKLFATTVEGVNRAIAKACEGFCEAVRDADTKITENLRKGCTFEAEVNVNKDLFEKLCGMKSEEEKPNPKGLVITTRGVTTANYSEATMNAIKEAVRKFEKSLPALDSWESTITGSIKVDDILGKTDDTEHKLEYGDAVRLPWRDYDYMYIGPYEESKTLVRMFDPKMHAMVTSHIGNVKYNGGKIVICDEEDLRKIWKDKK